MPGSCGGAGAGAGSAPGSSSLLLPLEAGRRRALKVRGARRNMARGGPGTGCVLRVRGGRRLGPLSGELRLSAPGKGKGLVQAEGSVESVPRLPVEGVLWVVNRSNA